MSTHLIAYLPNSTAMRGVSFPERGPIFLGKFAWGCQISWGAEFPVTPAQVSHVPRVTFLYAHRCMHNSKHLIKLIIITQHYVMHMHVHMQLVTFLTVWYRIPIHTRNVRIAHAHCQTFIITAHHAQHHAFSVFSIPSTCILIPLCSLTSA